MVSFLFLFFNLLSIISYGVIKKCHSKNYVLKLHCKQHVKNRFPEMNFNRKSCRKSCKLRKKDNLASIAAKIKLERLEYNFFNLLVLAESLFSYLSIFFDLREITSKRHGEKIKAKKSFILKLTTSLFSLGLSISVALFNLRFEV